MSKPHVVRERGLLGGFEVLEDRLALTALIQHLDASVTESVLTNGSSSITQWVDQSGDGNHATPAVGSAFFPSDNLFESGDAGVDFGASRNSLELFSALESNAWLDQSSGAEGFTVLIAFEADYVINNWNDLLGNSSTVSSGFGLRYNSSGSMQAYLGGETINKGGAAVSPNETLVYAFRYDATTGDYDFWDSANNSSVTGTIVAADFSVGDPVTLGATQSSSRYIDGMVGEVKVYDGALSNSEFVAERDSLLEKWESPADPTTIRWSELPDSDVMPDDVVVVLPNQTLILDENAEVAGLIIQGDFEVEDLSDLTLTSDWVLVLDGGSFRVGSEQNPFTHEFTLTLEGDDPNFDLQVSQHIAGHSVTINNNNAFLMARGAGSSIEIHADDASKESWTQLSQTAQAGDTVLHLDEATAWEVGDRVAIASTDFDLNQAEDFSIIAVADGGRTITLDAPLQYMHYGEIETYSNGTRSWDLDMRAEVGLLTRDVTIQGDADSAINRYGGHTMVMMDAEMHISGAEFTRMGQEGILGRYPAHWHLIGDASGQYIQNSSFHHTFNKGLTIHGTQNALVTENVVYEHIGHGYFLEDGAEFGNTLSYNLAINARASDSLAVAAESSDFNTVSSFWIENADNTFIGNHAAGSEFEGFRFDLRRVNGLSEDTGLYDDLDPRTKGPTEFTGNVAHTTVEAGIFITTPLVRDIQDTLPTADNQQLFDEDWGFTDFTSYKGEDTFWPRAIGGDFYEIKLAENGRSDRLRLNNTLYDSLTVGRTGNIGTPTSSQEIAAGRSLPAIGSFIGHVLYDGPGGLVDSHLDGFDVGDDAAFSLLNAVQKTTYHFTSGLTFGDNVAEGNKVDFSRQVNGDVESSARALVDLDGSLTGIPGAFVTQKMGSGSMINSTPGSIARDDWTAWVVTDAKIGSLVFNKYSGNLVEHDIIRSDGASNLGAYGSGDHTQTGFIVGDQYTHTIDFANNNISQVDLYMSDVLSGEGAVFVFSDFDPLSTVTVYNPYSGDSWDANQVDNLADLQAATTTSVYRGGGVLQVKLVSEMAYGWLWPQPALLPQQGPRGPGDFDYDGVVDIADYNRWRQSYGATSGAGLAADGNGDNRVDAADYAIWRNNLGANYASPADFLGGVTVLIDATPLAAPAISDALVAAMLVASAEQAAIPSPSSAAVPDSEVAVLDAVFQELLLAEDRALSNDDPWDDWEHVGETSASDGTSDNEAASLGNLDSGL